MDASDIKALVSSAIDDAKKWVGLEIALIKLDAAEASRSAGVMAFFIGLAIVFAGPALILLAFAAALGLQLATEWPLWLCYTLVGVIAASGALFCLWRALQVWEALKKEIGNGNTGIIEAGNRDYQPVITE